MNDQAWIGILWGYNLLKLNTLYLNEYILLQ